MLAVYRSKTSKPLWFVVVFEGSPLGFLRFPRINVEKLGWQIKNTFFWYKKPPAFIGVWYPSFTVPPGAVWIPGPAAVFFDQLRSCHMRSANKNTSEIRNEQLREKDTSKWQFWQNTEVFFWRDSWIRGFSCQLRQGCLLIVNLATLTKKDN